MTFRYLDYEASRQLPNIVVDGSPNESSVLALSQWPGVSAPPGLARDLSAEMTFADVAAAGDFATYRDRRAARASMALSRFAVRKPALSRGQPTLPAASPPSCHTTASHRSPPTRCSGW